MIRNYDQAKAYIDAKLVFGSRPGLERIQELLDILGNPQDQMPVLLSLIHI